MPARHLSGDSNAQTPADINDHDLISKMQAGDEAALQALIKRYDRLVRYTVYHTSRQHCRQDPHWLETVASSTWMGFIQSMTRHPNSRPDNLPAYMVRIARNQAISDKRRTRSYTKVQQFDENTVNVTHTDILVSPDQYLSKMEELEVLRDCLAGLDEDQRILASQLDSITQRRWKEAANTLGMRESTLRSRWRRVLELLRRCMERRTGKSFAPNRSDHDR